MHNKIQVRYKIYRNYVEAISSKPCIASGTTWMKTRVKLHNKLVKKYDLNPGQVITIEPVQIYITVTNPK